MLQFAMAIILGLFAGLCWAVHDLAARNLAPHMGGLRLGFRTEIIGFILLLPLLVQVRNGNLTDWLWILVLGLIYGAAIAGLFRSFAMAPISLVGPFTAGYPALVVIWGLFNGLSVTALQALGIAAIICGAIIVARMGPEKGGLQEVKGSLLQFFLWIGLANVSFATAIVLGQKLGPIFGDLETAGLLRVPAAIVLMIFALGEPKEDKKLGLPVLGLIALMAGLDILALTGINYMGRLPGKEMGAMAISSYGALAVLLASLFLKEKVSIGQWAGIALICAGVATLGS